MLPKTFRLVAFNNSGASADNVNVKYTPWYFDSANSGQLTYGSEVDAIAATTLADQALSKQTEVAANTNFGIKGTLEAIAAAPGAGNIELYIEWPDGAGTYPSDKTGAVPGADMVLLAVTPIAATPGRMTNFTYE